MALTNLVEYHRPADIASALALLGRRAVQTVPLAGGTELVARRDPGVQAVVDLGRLGLTAIRVTGGTATLGAMARIEALASAAGKLGCAGPALAQTLRQELPWQKRLAATLGGTLMSGGCAEMEALLWALDARIVLRTPGIETLDLPTFIAGRRRLAEAGALLTEVNLPIHGRNAGVGTARVARTAADRAIVFVAARVEWEGARCTRACAVASGVAAGPLWLVAVQRALSGAAWPATGLENVAREAMAAVSPPGDFRGSADYRRAMLGYCVQLALERAAQEPGGSAA